MEMISPSAALSRYFVGADIFAREEQKQPQVRTEAGSYHSFRIDDISLLISHDLVSEVAEDLAYCQLPNTRSVLLGMANLRGNIIPIFDLHELFGFVTAQSDRRKILILGRGEDAVAVMINDLPKRIEISDEQQLNNFPVLPDALRLWIHNGYQVDDVYFSWDMKGFFDSLKSFI